MISDALTNIIKKAFNSVGLEVHRRSVKRYQRNSFPGILQQARNMGLAPATVIDVGAAYGTFSLQCYNIFPDARYILVEPLEEYKPFLETVNRTIPKAQFIVATAHTESGETNINVHSDLVGSSLYLEEENSDVDGTPRTVRAVALDSLMKDCSAEPPYLIKIDVQGAELDVLLGSEEILGCTDYVFLEVSFFQFFQGGPQFYDIITFMKSRGFVAYDICGLQYRPLDNALSQADIAFVKESGLLRRHHFYATREQREEQNKRFASKWSEVMKNYR